VLEACEAGISGAVQTANEGAEETNAPGFQDDLDSPQHDRRLGTRATQAWARRMADRLAIRLTVRATACWRTAFPSGQAPICWLRPGGVVQDSWKRLYPCLLLLVCHATLGVLCGQADLRGAMWGAWVGRPNRGLADVERMLSAASVAGTAAVRELTGMGNELAVGNSGLADLQAARLAENLARRAFAGITAALEDVVAGNV
jgi:hypothetical protein